MPITQESHDENERERDQRDFTNAAIESMRENIEFLEVATEQKLELATLAAKLEYGRYMALVEAGFSTDQAMTLIVNGWSE